MVKFCWLLTYLLLRDFLTGTICKKNALHIEGGHTIVAIESLIYMLESLLILFSVARNTCCVLVTLVAKVNI